MNNSPSAVRRKLHVKRNPDRAGTACNGFVWASDRPQQGGPARQPSEACTAPSTHFCGAVDRHTSATASTSGAATEFRWLTDYLGDDEWPAAKGHQQTSNRQEARSQPPHQRQITAAQLPTKPQLKASVSWIPSWLTRQHVTKSRQQQVTTRHQQSRSAVLPQQPCQTASDKPTSKAATATTPGAAVHAVVGSIAGTMRLMQRLSQQVLSSTSSQLANLQAAGRHIRRQPSSRTGGPQHAPGQQPQHQTMQTQQQQQQHTSCVPAAVPTTAAAGAGVMSVLHDTLQSFKELYTDTLKPAAELIWQLLLGVYSLLAALLLYVCLPLLRVCIGLGRRVLLMMNSRLLPSRLMLQQQLTGRPSSPAATTGSVSLAIAAPASAGTQNHSAVDGSSEASCPTSDHDHDQQVLQLLQYSQQQLAAACKHLPGCLIQPQQLSSASSNSSTASSSSSTAAGSSHSVPSWLADAVKLPTSAGHGSCAYSAVLSGVPVAVQVYEITSHHDALQFCQTVQIVWSLRHPNLMLCLGAAVQLVPAGTTTTTAAAAGRSAVLPEVGLEPQQPQQQQQQDYVVAGCIVYQLLSRGVSLASGLQTLTSVQDDRSVGSPAASSSPAAASGAGSTTYRGSGRPVSAGQSAAAAVGNAKKDVASQQCLGSWKTRLQVAPQLVSALHHVVMTVTAMDAADNNWSSHINTQQLITAAVLDAATLPLQLKINPSLLLTGQSQRQQQRCEVIETGLAVALRSALLKLAVIDAESGSSSSSSSSVGGGGGIGDNGAGISSDNLQLLQQLARQRLAHEGVAVRDEAAHDVMRQYVTGVHSQLSSQQQQIQQQVCQPDVLQSSSTSVSDTAAAAVVQDTPSASTLSWTGMLRKVVAAPVNVLLHRRYSSSSSSSSRRNVTQGSSAEQAQMPTSLEKPAARHHQNPAPHTHLQRLGCLLLLLQQQQQQYLRPALTGNHC